MVKSLNRGMVESPPGKKNYVERCGKMRKDAENSPDHGSDFREISGGILAQGFGPGAIAVAVVGLAREADVSAGSDELFETAQVGAKLVVPDQAQPTVFEITPEPESEFFLERRSERYRFDFPAEAILGFFGQLRAEAAGVNTGAVKLGKTQQWIQVGFDFGEGLVVQLDAEAVPDHVAYFLADVDDAQIAFPGDVHAEKELRVGS